MPMSNVALYRKYRPQTFLDVRGQEQVISVLQGALANDALSHAYLFAGSRGTGKTSVARIFAREIGTQEHDLIEIDAASNRGIDDIRALRDGVGTLPFSSPYKVYIIDEVHMLTKEAFNALLKTLEEPPKHVVFILATTEIGKLPETVVSRCQVFLFKKPSHALLADAVCHVAKSEGRILTQASADLIALLGDGSFRDAHGMLEKVLSASSQKSIPFEDVERILGAPQSVLVNKLVRALAEKNLSNGLRTIEEALQAGADMFIFVQLIIQKIRVMLLLRYAKNIEKDIVSTLASEDFSFLQNLARQSGTGITSQTLAELLRAHEETPRTFIPQLPLELALVRLLGDIPSSSHISSPAEFSHNSVL